MPIKLSWLGDTKQALHSEYSDPLTIDEIMQAMNDVLVFLNEAPGKVVSVVDLRKLTRLPANAISTLPRVAQHPVRFHRKIGPVIAILDNSHIEQALRVFSRVYGGVRIVSAWEDAQVALAEAVALLGP